MEEIGNRLRVLRAIFHLTQEELASRVSLEGQLLRDLESGEMETLPPGLAACLEDVFGVNPDWFHRGIGPIFLGGSAGSRQQEKTQPTVLVMNQVRPNPDLAQQDHPAAPLVDGRVAARTSRPINPRDVKSLVWISGPALGDREGHEFIAVEVNMENGECMMPTLSSGDILLIDESDPGESEEQFVNDRIYALRNGQGGMSFNRLQKRGSGFVIISDNRKFPPAIAWTRSMRELIIGRVAWCWRNLLDS